MSIGLFPQLVRLYPDYNDRFPTLRSRFLPEWTTGEIWEIQVSKFLHMRTFCKRCVAQHCMVLGFATWSPKTCLAWFAKWRLIYRLIAIVWHVIWFSWLILQKIHRMVFTVFAGNRANQQALYNCLTHNRPYVLNSVSLRYLFFYQFVPFVPPLSSEEVSFSISLSCHPKWKCHMCVMNQIDSICFVLISVFVNANIHQQPGPPTSTISKTWEYFHAVPEQEI